MTFFIITYHVSIKIDISVPYNKLLSHLNFCEKIFFKSKSFIQFYSFYLYALQCMRGQNILCRNLENLLYALAITSFEQGNNFLQNESYVDCRTI